MSSKWFEDAQRILRRGRMAKKTNIVEELTAAWPEDLRAYLENALVNFDTKENLLTFNVPNKFIKDTIFKYEKFIKTSLKNIVNDTANFNIIVDQEVVKKSGQNIKTVTVKNHEQETKSVVVYDTQIKNDTKVIVSMHLEKQKFGRKHPYQASFDDLFDLDPIMKKEALKENINVIGTDFNPVQEKAIFTIQKILTVSGFYNKFSEDELNSMSRDEKMSCTIKIKPTQWYDYFGVDKSKTARNKMEYSGRGREHAVQALSDLASKKVLLVYKRHYYNAAKQERIDRIERKTSLISVDNLYEALSINEDKNLDHGKSSPEIEKKRFITIKLDPIFIDQIKNYYLTKPANYKEEIQQLGHGKVSKYVYNFIDWVLFQAEQKRRTKSDYAVRISPEVLAEALKMYAFIKKRQWKRIDEVLKQSFDMALQLNYILEQPKKEQNALGSDMYVIYLNPQKFKTGE
jgi:hypothetical protein